MRVTSCSHPECREPHGRAVYVTLDASQRVFCLYCFLVKLIELDQDMALEIEDEAELTNALINSSPNNAS